MKKVLNALILVSMLIMLTACGSKAAVSQETGSAEDVPQAEATEAAENTEAAPSEGDASAAPVFTADESQYRGGTEERIVKYYDPMGKLYLVEDTVYSAPGEVFSVAYTDADGNACAADENLCLPDTGDGAEFEVKEEGSEKTFTFRGDKGMKTDVIKYDEAGNPLKWTYFDEDGNIAGWVTYTYHFADGSESTGGDM